MKNATLDQEKVNLCLFRGALGIHPFLSVPSPLLVASLTSTMSLESDHIGQLPFIRCMSSIKAYNY